MPQLFALLLIAQLVGIVTLPLPLSAGIKQTLFIIGVVIFWTAAWLAIWSRQTLSFHWAHAADFQIIPGQELVTSGPYRWIRHPIYVAFFLMFIGIEIAVASWLIILAALLGWFVMWQSKKEETLLAQAFGEKYQEYSRQTGMFIPRL